jgi:hypothetical protein
MGGGREETEPLLDAGDGETTHGQIFFLSSSTVLICPLRFCVWRYARIRIRKTTGEGEERGRGQNRGSYVAQEQQKNKRKWIRKNAADIPKKKKTQNQKKRKTQGREREKSQQLLRYLL